MWKISLLLFLPFFLLQGSSPEEGLAAQLAYRIGSFEWSMGQGDLDILSELIWQDLHLLEIGMIWRRGRVSCSFHGGGVIRGWEEDCDYGKAGRNFLWSHSRSSVHGWGARGSGEWMLPFAWPLIPALGVALHHLILKSDQGRQVVEGEEHPYSHRGINKRFSTLYLLGYFGLHSASTLLGSAFELRSWIGMGYYWGRGKWYLRRNLEMIQQEALAWGGGFFATFYLPACPLEVGMGGQFFYASQGVHLHKYKNGTRLRQRLNSAFESFAELSLAYPF